MALEWALKLKDGFTAVAKRAGAAADELGSKISRAAKASDDLDAAGKKADTFRDKMGRLSHANGKFANEWTELARRIFGARFGSLIDGASAKWQQYGGVIKSVGKGLGIMAGAAIAAGTLAIAGIGRVIAAAEDFATGKSKAIFAFDKLLGGPAAAARAWDVVRAASEKTRTSLSETAASFNKLLAAGFDLPAADTLFKQLADLKALSPQANLDGIIRAISQIRNIGRLQGDELLQLSEAGVNVSDVYDELAKKLGKTKAEVQKLQAAGKIDAATAIGAIQAAISKRTGVAPGELAAKAPKSLAETAAIARDRFFDLINLDFSRVTKFIERIGESKGAGKFAEMIQRVFDVVTSPKALEFFEKLANGPGASFFEGFAEGFESVAKFFQDIDPGEMENFAALAKLVGQALGGLAAGLLFVSRAGAAFMDAIASVKNWFTTAGPEMSASASTIGSSIIDGIVSGVTSGAARVIEAVKATASGAVQAAKDVLGIASPSKVFEGLGRYTAQGMEAGIDSGAGGVADASGGLGVAAARAAGQTVGRSITQTRSTSTRSANITVQQNDPAQLGQQIRQIVRQEMRLATT